MNPLRVGPVGIPTDSGRSIRIQRPIHAHAYLPATLAVAATYASTLAYWLNNLLAASGLTSIPRRPAPTSFESVQ